jgi:uncharacterized protein (DUF1330 family)
MGASIEEHLRRIDATMEPLAGGFLIHGGELDVLEGPWPGHLIVIEFPDRARGRAWYESTRLSTDLAAAHGQLGGRCRRRRGVP